METEIKNQKILWRKVQVSQCIRVLLIFLGVVLMQLVAYMICVGGYTGYQMAQGNSKVQVAKMLEDYMTSSDSSLLIWVSAVSALLCMIWCGILYRKSDWRRPNFSYDQAFTAKRLAGIVGIGFGGCVVLSVGLSVLMHLFSDAFSSYQELMSHLDTKNNWMTLLYVIVIGPVSEELIFRGAILDRLKIAFPLWLANILQAVLFGVYHMNLIQGGYAFCLGTALGLVCQVTGSILGSIFTHIIFNATSDLLGILFDGTGQYEDIGMLVILVVAVMLLVMGIGYYLEDWKKQKGKTGIHQTDVVK